MKSDKKIFVAFVLNMLFSIIEFIGGAITGSVAIISDAIHDLGDGISIGTSYVLEKISKKKPDLKYTYGYLRYSVLGSLITTFVLIAGSVTVIYSAVLRLLNPIPIDYDKMIILAIIGVLINFLASYFTKDGDSLNQKAVNLHMLEDVLGWTVVLIGAIVMKFTDFVYIDSLMSIAVAVFILFNALKNLKQVLDIFFEKTPNGVEIEEIKEHLLKIDGVSDVHHLHIRSIDGFLHVATLHVVTEKEFKEIKKCVKEELKEHGIAHTTIEIETPDEDCGEKECTHLSAEKSHHHHHHHHH